jgi:hypothetical protein
MGFLGRLFNATPKEEVGGIRMDFGRESREVEGKATLAALLRALEDFLPDGSSENSSRQRLRSSQDRHS